MVSISPNCPAAPEDAIDGAGHANRKALKAAHEGGVLVGLDEEVEVIGLNAVVQEPKTPT